MAMTGRERNELIRIVKGRFKLLREQAKDHGVELVQAEQRSANLEAKDRIDAYNERINKIRKKLEPIEAEIRVLTRELEGDELVGWSGGLSVNTSMRIQGRARRLNGPWYKSRSGEFLSPIVGHVLAELDRAELAMIEEILVGGFENEEAKQMLARIPTIDKIIEGKVELEQLES